MRPSLPGLLAASALLLAQAPAPASPAAAPPVAAPPAAPGPQPAPTAKATPQPRPAAPPKAAPEPKPEPGPNVVHVPPTAVVAVLGLPVTDPEGKPMGRLIDVLVNMDGHPTAAVIDFGGFMGIGARKIAVRWDALHFAPGAKKMPITLDWTIDQIRAAPEYVSRHVEAPVVVSAPKQPAPEPKPSAPASSR